MTGFQKSLVAQGIWFGAASTFNLLSMRAIAQGQVGWAGPTPLTAQIVATLMACVILLGVVHWIKAYRFAAPVVLVLLFVGGVYRHLVADSADYASSATWAFAIGINLYGCCVFSRGVLLAWRDGNRV
jgi:hypothetical protein